LLIYNFLKQLDLCTVEFRPKGSSGYNGTRPFETELVFVDNGKLVCDVVIDPVGRDLRTGEWTLIATIGTAFGLRLSDDLRNSIREYAKEITRQMYEMFMGDSQ
jgi:hypothetical protein